MRRGKRRTLLVLCALLSTALFGHGCGGKTHLGTTGGEGAASGGEDGGDIASGGRSNIGGRGSGGVRCPPGAPCRPPGGAPGMGGRYVGGTFGMGGRPTGGAFGSGGFFATGGAATGGVSPADASIVVPPFDAGSDPSRNRVPAGHVCERLTTIQCAGIEHCCGRPGVFAACKQAAMNSCQQSVYFDALSASPLVAYDINRAEAAFAELEKRASVCDPDVVAWVISDAGFRNVARGTVAPGGSCNPQYLDGSTGAMTIAVLGACQDPEKYACLESASGADTIWSCAPRGAEGTPCFSDMNCVDGYYCNFQGPGSIYTCARRKPDGVPCKWFLECQSLNCASDQVCRPQTPDSAYCSLLANLPLGG